MSVKIPPVWGVVTPHMTNKNSTIRLVCTAEPNYQLRHLVIYQSDWSESDKVIFAIFQKHAVVGQCLVVVLPELCGGTTTRWLTDLCTTAFLARLESVVHISTCHADNAMVEDSHSTDLLTPSRPTNSAPPLHSLSVCLVLNGPFSTNTLYRAIGV